MVGWQVTATTLHCEAVDDEVTIMVYRDWSVKCTGHRKYGGASKEAASLLTKRGKRLNRQLECNGVGCILITQYKNKLVSEESEKGEPS